MKISWGTKLVFFMALFMGFIIFLTVKLMREDISLIQKDYYEVGENYQAIIDENKGVDSLINVQFTQKNNGSKIGVKSLKSIEITNAKLQFICLANNKNDKTLDIQIIDTLTTIIDLSDFKKGKWISRLYWIDKYGKHYSEKNFNIQ